MRELFFYRTMMDDLPNCLVGGGDRDTGFGSFVFKLIVSSAERFNDASSAAVQTGSVRLLVLFAKYITTCTQNKKDTETNVF